MQASKRWCSVALAGALLVSALSVGSVALAQGDEPPVDIHSAVVAPRRHYAPAPPPSAPPMNMTLILGLLGLAATAASSVWVGNDMDKHHVRGPWMVITVVCWIVGLPLYLARRRSLIEAAAKEWLLLEP